eukprot:COSAG02_NODE_940_length_15773_cov_5.301263_3_plen_115_part_00
MVFTLDSLAEAISWDALELPILCVNADDAKRIHAIVEGLADVPRDQPWNVSLVGDHLDPIEVGLQGTLNDDLQWQPRYSFAQAQPVLICRVCANDFTCVFLPSWLSDDAPVLIF